MMDHAVAPTALLEALVQLARRAGDAVMAVYRSDFVVSGKADASPVTAADLRAEAIITPALLALWPGVPVVAEEAQAEAERAALAAATEQAQTQAVTAGAVVKPAVPAPAAAQPRRFWLVDPLDGTREFVQRNDQFTVNIALIEQGLPVLGVVLAPALGRLFAGAMGQGAFVEEQGQRRGICARLRPAAGLTVCSSRSHGKASELQHWLAQQQLVVAEHQHAGSSLKFGLLAAGEADCYPRLSRTMEWDTAAGHAVLAAAGGHVLTLDGQPLRYGKPGFENPSFVAWGQT
jgi:3'(2'), 5'-bisphosphate nucleotidase